ncbi:MAG: hypothetical protein ACT4PU_08970 [Planctomycetota bacterium]
MSLTLLGLLAADSAAQFGIVRVAGGRVAIHFEASALQAAGLEIADLVETAPVGALGLELTEPPLVAFGIDSSSSLLLALGHDGTFVPYGVLGGKVQALGGFRLVSTANQTSVDFQNFQIEAVDVRNDGPGGEPDPDYFFLRQGGPEALPASGLGADFKLCYVKIAYDADGNPYEPGPGDHAMPLMRIKAWDLIVTPTLAAKLRRPDLADRTLGTGLIDGEVLSFDGAWSYLPGQNPGTPLKGGDDDAPPASSGPGDGGIIDVKLGLLSGLTQLGHTGTFPNGRAGLAMSTTSCNDGTLEVPWQAPMAENHPGISQQLYRQMGNRFEQVAQAWIKHGFFALSNSQCTPCQGGGGSELGIGCSDTYGTTNNGDRFYLGPRDEWNPHTGEWDCLGSFFDATPVDCVRNYFGTGVDSVDHRLEANDSDLNNAGALYFYEAIYIVREDVDLQDNIGSRRATMSWNGSTWIFTTPSAGSGNPLIEGPAINRWGDLRTVANLNPHDGRVVLGVNTVDLGGGLWRYEYALFNWTLDRKVRSFSVPSCGSASDFYFHDTDNFASNDWAVTQSGGNVSWTFPDVFPTGVKVAGPLAWATLYNFGFTSDVAPGTRNAVLTLHDPGPGGDLLGVSTLAPGCVELSSTVMAPAVSQPFSLQVKGGSNMALIVLMEVSGIPLSSPLLIGPVPYVSGTASIPVSVPAIAAGLDLLMVGGDVTVSPLSLVQFSNWMELQVQ